MAKRREATTRRQATTTTRRRSTAPAATPPVPEARHLMGPANDVFARTVPFMWERHMFGEGRNVSLAHVDIKKDEGEQDPNRRLLSLRKRLLDSPKVRALHAHHAAFREFLVTQAAMPFRPGLVLVPVGMIETVDARALAWETTAGELADEAAREYPSIVESMRAPNQLGPLFNPRDYPPVERYRASFWVRYRFIDLGVPNLLREVKVEVFQRERAKVERDAARATEMIQQHLRSTLLELTNHLHHLLTPKGDGKWPAIRENSLDNFNTFLATLELRDVTNDEDLRRVVRQLRGLSHNGLLSRDELKDDAAFRARIGQEVGEVKAVLETLVVDQPRGIRIRDEEEVA